MEIYLVRHGETTWNERKRIQGWVSIPLNARGRAQAVKLRELLKGVKFDAVYSSDLKRAVETARIIAEPHGLKVIEMWQLREVKRGLLNGLTLEEIASKFPGFLKKFSADPYTTRPPEGESLRNSEERIRDALEYIRKKHPHGRVLIVAHALTNIVIQHIVTEEPVTPQNYRKWFMQPGEYRILEWHGARTFQKKDLVGTWKL